MTSGPRDGSGDGRDRDSGDLALALLVERPGRAVRRRLPDELYGVPTTVEPWAGDRRPAGRSRVARSTRTCADRILTFHEPLVGGVPVHPKRGDAQLPDGTAGVVCWDAEDGAVCLVTAAHVAYDDGEFFDALYHDGMDGDDRYRDELVARHAAHSTAGDGGVDAAKYRVVDGASAGPLASVGRDLPDVTGSWEFEGLADATAAGAVPVRFAGRSTCYAESECVGTFRSALVDYAVRVRPGIAVAGDSGGAFLDPRGRLVGLFTHHNPSENSGPVGSVALDRVGARLSPPT